MTKPVLEFVPTRVRNRETGEMFEERVFGGTALHRLYGEPAGRLLTRSILTRSLPSHIYGWLQRRSVSKSGISAFVSQLNVNADEAELTLDQYTSLNDFFTRRLKPGVRPIDFTPEHFISPADGRVLVYQNPANGLLSVKGSRISLDELLRDSAVAARYRGGSSIVVRLAPADYHRFHFPENGTASPARDIPGPLHSVHPIALLAGAPSFLNKRSVTELATDRWGLVLMVEVGALFVGTIVQTYRPGPVLRGDEKGYFRFGGSTIILVVEPGRLELDADLVEASSSDIEVQVRMGTRLGRSP